MRKYLPNILSFKNNSLILIFLHAVKKKKINKSDQDIITS